MSTIWILIPVPFHSYHIWNNSRLPSAKQEGFLTPTGGKSPRSAESHSDGHGAATCDLAITPFFQDMPDTHPRKSGRQFSCSVGSLGWSTTWWNNLRHCLYLPKPFPKLIQVFEVAATKMNADSSRPQEKFTQPLHAMLVWSFWFHRCAFSKQISCNYHLECARNGDFWWLLFDLAKVARHVWSFCVKHQSDHFTRLAALFTPTGLEMRFWSQVFSGPRTNICPQTCCLRSHLIFIVTIECTNKKSKQAIGHGIPDLGLVPR